MEAVAPRDDVALELLRGTLVGEEDTRPLGLDVLDPDVVDLEEEGAPGLEAGLDQVLHDLRLPVHHDRLAARQGGHVDPVPLARELQLDAVVHEPLARHPLAHAGIGEEVDDALLEHARANAGLDVLAAPVLQDHRLDPRAMEQLGERQPGRPRSDDRHLGAHHAPSRENSAAWPCPTPMHIVARP